jgi:murein DD-endopeptidase MepM/ murein hydrolase activator NlpD
MGQGFIKRLLPGFLVLAVFAVAVLPVYGDELSDLRKLQEKTNKEIQTYRSIIKEKDRELRSLTDQLRELDEDIAAIEKDLSALEEELVIAQEKVGQAEIKLQEAEASLAERNEIFTNRLVEIYCSGDLNYLEVLLSSTDFTDFLVRYELLSKIADQDIKLLEEIEDQKAEIEATKAELEAHRDEIIDVKTKTEEKKANLDKKRKQQEELRHKISTEKEAAEKALAEEERTSREVAQKIREIQARLYGNNKSKYTGGVFTWPTPGYEYITSDYGMRVHPILKVKKLHTGIDIRAPKGAEIVAAAGGTVTYAGWLGAYGNTVLIEHGGSITTLYGHMSSISVKAGDTVDKGDTIGKVGSTGLSTGPHLHFEVRVNGDPTSPWDYLK